MKYGGRTVCSRSMAEPRRIRTKRNLTLNPDGVARLMEVGAARAVPETNLSRLVDDAIADYVERNWKPAMRTEPVRRRK